MIRALCATVMTFAWLSLAFTFCLTETHPILTAPVATFLGSLTASWLWRVPVNVGLRVVAMILLLGALFTEDSDATDPVWSE